MRTFAIIAVVLAVLAVASAAPFGHTKDWKISAPAVKTDRTPIVFVTKQRNMDTLEEYLLEVSNPKSASYGEYLSLKQLGAMTSNWEATNKIVAWVLASGIPEKNVELTVNGDFVKVDASIAEAEKLFNTHYFAFEHETQGKIHRAPTADIPEEIRECFDIVTGTTEFPSTGRPTIMVSEQLKAQDLSLEGGIPSGYTYPQLLYKAYGVSDPSVAAAQSTCAVYENLGQSYSPTDLSSFQSKFQLATNPIAKVIGPNTPSNPGGEASLDVQYLSAMAQNSPMTYWSIAQTSQHPFLDFVMGLSNDATAPLVSSMSYGSIEPLGDKANMQAFNQKLIALGSRGLTVIVSSGDDGVANFQARSDPSKCGFNPSFPATSPYVTAVGATQGIEVNKAPAPCLSSTGGLITTGGGFSTVFDIPSYQSDAVSGYKSSTRLPPSTAGWSNTGRGYPDVAANGHNYIVYVNGQTQVVSGTSASSPVFAGMITLVNGQRLAAGKPALGFLNPALYQAATSNPEIFHDVPAGGENNCCAGQSNPVCCTYGFLSATGWDPLTGLGDINFGAFSQHFASL